MKTINVAFENREYTALVKSKGKKTWRRFIIEDTKTKVPKDNANYGAHV